MLKFFFKLKIPTPIKIYPHETNSFDKILRSKKKNI